MTGIFDSGVGGLSVFREIRKILPQERYIYFSDNAHCPYGEKSKEYVIDRAREITRFLLEKGADIIVVACNTATAAAISTLREEFPVKFIGMEPAIKPAVQNTRTGVVGVLATAGTLRADKYIHTREKFAEGIRIEEHVGQGFVELVESGNIYGEEAEATVRKSLEPLLSCGADTIVLGCTHYPFLAGTIGQADNHNRPGSGRRKPSGRRNGRGRPVQKPSGRLWHQPILVRRPHSTRKDIRHSSLTTATHRNKKKERKSQNNSLRIEVELTSPKNKKKGLE